MGKGSERLKPGKSIVKSSIIKSGINIQEFTKNESVFTVPFRYCRNTRYVLSDPKKMSPVFRLKSMICQRLPSTFRIEQ